MTAIFPGSVKNFGSDRVAGDIIPPSDMNDLRAETVAIETALLGGWLAQTETWVYVSADGATGVISVNADMTATIGVGMKIKLTQTTVKYFIVVAAGAYSGGNTLITVDGGTDYVLANAAISAVYRSRERSPFGFPMSPAKWTISLSDTTNGSQSSPAAGTWYNPRGLSIVLRIGAWNVFTKMLVSAIQSPAGLIDIQGTLSTNNAGAETDPEFTGVASSTSDISVAVLICINKPLVLATKATYYPNIRTTYSLAGGTIYQANGGAGIFVKAVNAYL